MILVKFLRARNLVVSDAADMLAATLKWRAEVDVDAIMEEEFDQDVFGRLGKVYGKDKDGRPIAWNLYGEVKDMKAVFGDTQKFIRCVSTFVCGLWRGGRRERRQGRGQRGLRARTRIGTDTFVCARRWRVQFMEQSIAFLDFETVDQMVQIHGPSASASLSLLTSVLTSSHPYLQQTMRG